MTSTQITYPTSASRGGLRPAVSDGLVIAWRNLKRVPRIPELAIFAIIQSIIFVLLFAFVFGGAIALPGGQSYRSFLMPGIFVQTLCFAAITTAIGLTDDMNKGIIDRFRSLPMARSAVLTGRTAFDLVYNSGIIVVLMITGLAIGWRVNTDVTKFLLACVLMLAFTYVMSWVGVLIGLSVPTVEVAQQLGFIVIFPLTFLSSAFVPIATMPSWLQPFVEWNPVSTMTGSLRELFGNPNPNLTDAFPSQHPMLVSVWWIIALLVAFAPLAVRKYRTVVH